MHYVDHVKHKNLASNKLVRVKFPLEQDNKAYVLSISPSSERIEGLIVVCVYIGDRGAMSVFEKWWCEHMCSYVNMCEHMGAEVRE